MKINVTCGWTGILSRVIQRLLPRFTIPSLVTVLCNIHKNQTERETSGPTLANYTENLANRQNGTIIESLAAAWGQSCNSFIELSQGDATMTRYRGKPASRERRFTSPAWWVQRDEYYKRRWFPRVLLNHFNRVASRQLLRHLSFFFFFLSPLWIMNL